MYRMIKEHSISIQSPPPPHFPDTHKQTKWSYLISLTKTIHALTHIKIMGFCAHYKYSLNTWYVPLYKTTLLIIHSHFTHTIYWLLLDKYCLSVKVYIFLKHFNDILPILQGFPLIFFKISPWKNDVPAVLFKFEWNSVNSKRKYFDLSGEISSQVGRQTTLGILKVLTEMNIILICQYSTFEKESIKSNNCSCCILVLALYAET